MATMLHRTPGRGFYTISTFNGQRVEKEFPGSKTEVHRAITEEAGLSKDKPFGVALGEKDFDGENWIPATHS